MKKSLIIAGDGDVDQRWRFFVLCSDASYSDGDVRKKQRCDGNAIGTPGFMCTMPWFPESVMDVKFHVRPSTSNVAPRRHQIMIYLQHFLIYHIIFNF